MADYSAFIGAARPGAIAFDVGAHIGTYSLGLCHAVGRCKTVHAFEPNPITFQRLNNNIALNHFANSRLNQLAVSDQSGPAVLSSPTSYNTGGGSLVPHNLQHGLCSEFYQVNAVSIDHYCATENLSRIDLIKIDAQGYELQVLRGAEHSIRRWRPRLMVEYDPYWLTRAGSSGKELLSLLRSYGYSLFEVKRGRLMEAELGDDLVNVHYGIALQCW